MRRKVIFSLLVLTLILVPLLATACEEEVTPPAQEEEEEQPPAEQEEEEEEANWWDELGEPQYGGTLTIRRANIVSVTLDPANPMGGIDHDGLWLDPLFQRNWALDPSTSSLSTDWAPVECFTGALAESWEQTDPLTITVHIREGVYWQDKEPVNGREFTADDVQYNYDRILGTGSGFTEVTMYYGMQLAGTIERAVATDEYTVVFELKQPSVFAMDQLMNYSFPLVAPEWVQQGDLENWESAVGTGPWILTDFVQGSSITYSRNPDYWDYDERYPQNQLPYAETLKCLAISDMTTSLAALRTGQIDTIIDRQGPTWQQVESLAETNPEIQQISWPMDEYSVTLRCDNEPFTDIRVRKALQMAIDRETIAATHYGGTVDGEPAGLVNPVLEDWSTPYDEWPADLQAEYSYDPDTAKALLAEAAADGVFEPNEYGGFDTNCVSSTTWDMELLEIIKSEFMDIGVDMTINAMEILTFAEFTTAGKHDQMVFAQLGAGAASPLANMGLRTQNEGLNYSHNDDPDYEAMFANLALITDITEAQNLVKEMDLYALEQHWSVNVCPTVNFAVWQPWVKGYTGEYIAGYTRYYERMWIDLDLKESLGY